MYKILISVLFLTTVASGATYSPPPNNRADLDLNSAWRFYKGDPPNAHEVSFDDSGWDPINLPHTWNNLDGQDGGNDYYRGVSWYRKHYTVSGKYSGRNFFIKFDGANLITDLYLNGNYVGQHRGGYAAFAFDVTPYIIVGADNVIAVKVNNAYHPDVAPLSADFTFFGGIYRGVHLLVTDQVHVTPLDYGSSGVYLKQTNVSSASADLQATVKVWNSGGEPKTVTVKTTIVDAESSVILILTSAEVLPANSGRDFLQSTTISNPRLWNGLADPYMYRAFVEILCGGNTVDLVSQPLAFRSFSIDPDNGFHLNGQYLDLRGVNRHQDRLDKGWAIGEAEHLEDFNLILEMGCTAVRLSHYQQAEYVYDFCDNSGLLVWTEIPLVNRVTESTEFYDNAKQQLIELIRQNYNHPSIMFWGVYNEITNEPGGDPAPLVRQLVELAALEDPTRLSTCATNTDGDPINWYTDITGFNHYFGWYYGSFSDFASWADTMHLYFPEKKIGVGEFGAGASIYQHTDNPTRPEPYGTFHPEEWQNLFHEAHWTYMKVRPFLWCKLIWNMFDFASDERSEGDTAGRNDKGLVTYDRQTKKDAFYWFKANWTSNPFVYITSRRFTVRVNPTVEVKIYSNCDSVELKVNGVSQGTQTGSDRLFIWRNISLVAGENRIEAIGTASGEQYLDDCTWRYSLQLTATR